MAGEIAGIYMTEEKWRNSLALGHAARRGGRLEQALAHYHSALSLAPDNAETNSVYGLMLLHLNRVDEATAPLKRAVDIDPSQPAARMNLAELYVRRNDIPNAIRIVETLASETPQFWWIWDKLGELKARANRFSEAAAHFRQAVERKQNDPSLVYKWSRATFDSGSPAEAKVILDSAARLAPGHEAILRLYAEIYEGSSDWSNLERTAQSWLRTQTQNPLPWMFAAKAQWETGYMTQAMQSYRTFLDRGGKNAMNLATFGRLCLTALAYDEASRALDEAERLDAECGHMLSAKATLSMFRGQFQDALAYARRATGVNPLDTAAFKLLVQVSGGNITQDEYAQLRRLSENGSLRPEDRICASFALADYFDAQGNIEAAFAGYEHANKLSAHRAQHELLGYDRTERKRQTEQLISIFPAVPQTTQTSARPIPIFIVGMPRSGTTLIESIIGAHSKVFACGERQEMRSIMQEFVALAPNLGMSSVLETTKQQWRDAFFRELPDLSGAIAITDKNPWNFDALGVIFELFPQARVVHVRRDPVETGLSIFRNEFPKFASFANRLEDIGHYYGEYARLMSHWQDVLRNRFMTIQYEDLLADFAGALPELLQFCGLEWEEACTNFSTSNRVINTMSTVQVRQPLSAFRGRRGRYAQYLSPLISALGDARVDLQSGAFAPDRLPERSETSITTG
jgi:tetratricopeptide (TPR) repeat protein